jgi:hypothetical protein
MLQLRLLNPRCAALGLACVLSLAGGGCARKTVRAAAPVDASPAPSLTETERPMSIAPDTDATPPVEPASNPPSLPAASTAPSPVTIPSGKSNPTPRRPTAGPPATEAAAEPQARPSAPQISPQLSPGDQASYERKTNEDISAAEKNLQEASGKQLTVTQRDLVEKIRNFVAQSRDASKGGDWARAQNLAQKARFLSVELVNGL